jgi:hypothetical protein
MDTYDGTYHGFPLRSQDDSEDDCRRTSWSVLVDNEWHEIVCCALNWREDDAAQGLLSILNDSRTHTRMLATQALVEAQEIAGNEPTNERIRVITKLLQKALGYDETTQKIAEQ